LLKHNSPILRTSQRNRSFRCATMMMSLRPTQETKCDVDRLDVENHDVALMPQASFLLSVTHAQCAMFCWQQLSRAFVDLAIESTRWRGLCEVQFSGSSETKVDSQCELKLSSIGNSQVAKYVPPHMRKKMQSAKYVPPHMRPKYVPPHLRTASLDARKSDQMLSQPQAVGNQGRPSLPIGLGEKTLSVSSDASTVFGFSDMSELSSPCSTRASSPRASRRVRFLLEVDEVHYVEKLPLHELLGCKEQGNCWYEFAKQRMSRFRLCAHGERVCLNKGCTCDSAGLCSRGGKFAEELGIGIPEVFSAWRRMARIPASVSNMDLKRGLTWPMR